MTCPTYTNQLNHLRRLSESDLREWQLYAWKRAKELEADPSGLWLGISAELVATRIGPDGSGVSVNLKPTKPR